MDITLVVGCFDPLHAGHILMLEEVSKLGYPVVVGLTGDSYINKPGHPIMNEYDRLKTLLAIKHVSSVKIYNAPNALALIEELKPKIYVKGEEYLDGRPSMLAKEEAMVKKYGGRMYFSKMYGDVHSSKLNTINKEAYEFLACQFFTLKDVHDFLTECKSLRVLVIGEAIVDSYIPVKPLCLAPKTTAIAYKELGSANIMMGGSVYVARMLAEYCKAVTLLTYTGNDQFTIPVDNQKVGLVCFSAKDRPTVCKTRYVIGNTPILMLTNAETDPIETDLEERIINWLTDNMENYDIILVTDFCHGLLTQNIINHLTGYKAATVQSGESNFGICYMDRYKDYNYLSLTASELRFACNDINGDISSLIRAKIGSRDYMAVTLGVEGSVVAKENKLAYVPCIINTQDGDPIGAGDTFFSLSALATFLRLDPELVGFIGNCAAGIKTRFTCTSTIVEPNQLLSLIERVL